MQPPRRKARQSVTTTHREPALVYEKLSDPILVRRARDGDRKALATLCERHAPRVERLALHLLDDAEDARDASQEALAKLCVRLPQFRGEARFTTWLHRLTVNTCRDVAARQRIRRHEPLLDDPRTAPDADPARSAERAELRAELGASLQELSPSQARVVVLKDAFDFSFEEISAASGMPVGTAKCYAHRARNGLREKLGPSDCSRRVTPIGREEIEAILPHRDPFLLLDEVIELEPGKRVVARKKVRDDEFWTQGHFPGRPVMPGVLIVEAMAQAGAVAVLSEEENRGKIALFAGIDGVRFKRIVEPGDELELTCELETVRGPIGRGKARATVDGKLAARGTLTFAVER